MTVGPTLLVHPGAKLAVLKGAAAQQNLSVMVHPHMPETGPWLIYTPGHPFARQTAVCACEHVELATRHLCACRCILHNQDNS